MLSRNFLPTLLLSTLLCAALPAVAAPRYAVTALPAGSNPTGINNAGQIVGDIGIEGGGRRAFTWSAGTLVQYGTLGGSDSAALAINDSGRIIGNVSTLSGDRRAVTGSGGALTDLNVFGGTVSSFGRAINNGGQVAGAYNTPGGMGRAFSRSGALEIDLGTLGGSFAVANGINSAGDIVGFSSLDDTSAFLAHAFLYSGGVMQDLGTMAGASLSEATAINDSGVITGHGWVAGSQHAFIYSDGIMRDLGTLGGRDSFAYDINNLGQVVGHANDPNDFDFFAYIYDAGRMTNLNTLIDPASGWTLYAAAGINDSEQIAAYGCRADQCGAVLLDLAVPVPEPGTLALLAAGLMLLGSRRYTGRQMDNIARQMRAFSPP